MALEYSVALSAPELGNKLPHDIRLCDNLKGKLNLFLKITFSRCKFNSFMFVEHLDHDWISAILVAVIIIIIIIIYLLYHSLCWCLFVHQPGAYHAPGASDTQFIHSDHALKHLPEDSCRSQHADLLGLCHSSSLRYSLDVFFHTLLYCTKHTNNHRDHFSFHLPHALYF